MLTETQKQLVQETFALVAPQSDMVAELFYKHLFEIAPAVKPMFQGDMKAQGAKLMQTLAVVVHGLDRLETLVPSIEAMAKRHVNYGVLPEHYIMVGGALLATLEDGLGEEFTVEVEEAWTNAYSTLSQVMINASYAEMAL